MSSESTVTNILLRLYYVHASTVAAAAAPPPPICLGRLIPIDNKKSK